MGQESDIKCSADVIIAALNEEEGIGPTLAEISQNISPNQVLVVDGHSHDRTVEISAFFGLMLMFVAGEAQNTDTVSRPVAGNDTTRYINGDVNKYYGPVLHKVEEGETVESIVKRFNMAMDDFKGWNYLPNGLKPGMTVVIRFDWGNNNNSGALTTQTVTNKATEGKYHTVAAGETLYHISVLYHVTVQQLKDWNSLNSNTVAVGQKLQVSP